VIDQFTHAHVPVAIDAGVLAPAQVLAATLIGGAVICLTPMVVADD
jgi:thiazole synthase ThiGH ThiG subunit